MEYDTFDICEAYWLYADWYNTSGLTNRCRKTGRGIHSQLHRMGFKISPLFKGYESLSENGQEIFNSLVEKWE